MAAAAAATTTAAAAAAAVVVLLLLLLLLVVVVVVAVVTTGTPGCCEGDPFSYSNICSILFFVQLADVSIPLTSIEIGGLLSTKVLSTGDWMIIISVAFSVLIIEEFRKFIVNSKIFAIKTS